MKSRFLFKILAFTGLLFVLGCMIFLGFERSQYNLISNEELQIVREKIQKLNSQEKKDLAYFFNYANFFCQYPYTLVGYKPMSICNYLQESDDLPSLLRADYQRPKHRIFADSLERGFNTWKKYQSLFPQKKYLIIRYHASNSKGMNEVALIHCDLCFNEIKKHLADFNKILQKTMDVEEVFTILIHPDHESFYKITQDDLLLGVLLGYGRNNAYLFENKKHKQLKGFSDEWPAWPRKWRLPGFMCDHNTIETKLLEESYKKARKYIRWTYFNRNDLEVTLALLEKD